MTSYTILSTIVIEQAVREYVIGVHPPVDDVLPTCMMYDLKVLGSNLKINLNVICHYYLNHFFIHLSLDRELTSL